MKKITIMAALLGSVYFANAQVGIGTSTPAETSQLEIAATDKGVLIPRVELTEITSFSPITGSPAESLLVYNTIGRNDVEAGYYYWANNEWNRVINASDLDDIMGPKIGDVIYTDEAGDMVFQYYDGTEWQTIDFSDLVAANETKTFFRKVEEPTTENAQYLYFSEQVIQDWLAADDANTVVNIPDANAAITIDAVADVVSNFENILQQTTEYNTENITIEKIIQEIASQVEGNVIYKNIASAGDPAEWVFQYWNGTQYLTIPLNDLVAAAESKTTIVEYNGNQYYLSETYIAGGGETDTDEWTAVPAGAILIDVVAGVVNNFETILQEETTILVDGSTTDYYTVEEYIEYISQNAMQSGVTKIVLDGSGQASFQTWNTTTEDWDDVVDEAFSDIVKINESKTSIEKEISGTVANGDIAITYDYFNENQPDIEGAPQATIDMNADVLNLINNNTVIRQAITDVLNLGGNVYFGDHDEDANTPDTFYTIDVNGDKQPIDISGQVISIITNNSNDIKNILGDEYSTTEVTNTGDTWIDGNNIYKGVFSAIVQQGTANVSEIDLSATNITTVGDVISIKILDDATNTIINTATTDVVVTTAGMLSFKIGTGNMYQVLNATADVNVKVIVEFSAEE